MFITLNKEEIKRFKDMVDGVYNKSKNSEKNPHLNIFFRKDPKELDVTIEMALWTSSLDKEESIKNVLCEYDFKDIEIKNEEDVKKQLANILSLIRYLTEKVNMLTKSFNAYLLGENEFLNVLTKSFKKRFKTPKDLIDKENKYFSLLSMNKEVILYLRSKMSLFLLEILKDFPELDRQLDSPGSETIREIAILSDKYYEKYSSCHKNK